MSDAQYSAATRTVVEKMDSFAQLSATYNTNLQNALSQIANIKLQAPDAPDILKIQQINLPNRIERFRAPLISIPSGYNIDTIFQGLNDSGLPSEPNIPPSIALTIGAPPVKPQIDTQLDIPNAPKVVFPELGNLERITIPKFSMPEIPLFDGKPPSADGIHVPNVFIRWKEPTYHSEILDVVQAKIKGIVSGNDTATGLPAAVEDALFSRARDRVSAETERSVQETVDTWAARGFPMPHGVSAKHAESVREQGRLQAAELNRDIMVQSAQWHIDTLRFAVEKGIALEQLTQNLYSNMVNRLFESARFQAESQINMFNAHVSLFNARIAAYESLSQAYKTKLEGILAKLSAFKAEIEAQAAIGQINQQKVDIYRAKLGAVQSSVDIYRAIMSGVQAKADTIKTQLEAYRTDIQAYGEQISAEKLKIDSYQARVGMYESQVRAYAARVGVATSKAQAMTAKYAADIDAYRARIQAESDGYRAQMQAFTAESEMMARFADMNTRTNISYAQLQMSRYQVMAQNSIQQAQLAMESAKAVGQYTAQLAAGALSAQHVSASISSSSSDNTSKSTSTNTSHNYSY